MVRIEQKPVISCFWAAVGVAILTALLFSRGLSNEFVNWDDDLNFTLNESYRGLGPAQVTWMFTTFHMGHYQPLTWLTLGLDYELWGMNPAGYHLTSLLLHAGCAAAFVYLGLRLYEIAGSTAPHRSRTSLLAGATAAGCLFAVHPLRVESVTWITERRDCLSGLLLVLAVHAYTGYALEVNTRRRRRQYLLSLGFFALSLFSKAWGITFPIVLLILDFYPLRRVGWHKDAEPVREHLPPPHRSSAAPKALGAYPEGRRPPAATRWSELFVEKIPFVILALAAAVVAVFAVKQAGALRPLVVHGWQERIAQAAYGLMFYLVKTLWPSGLHTARDFFAAINPLDTVYVSCMLAVLAITGACVWSWRRRPAWIAAWAAYAVIISPVLGLMQSGTQLVAERYSYLACMSWALMAGAAVQWLYDRNRGKQAVFGACGVVLVLSVITWKQIGYWRNTETLWNRVLAVNPDSVTGNYYKADLLAMQGQTEAAVAHYRRALKHAPDYREVHANLGITLTAMQQFEEARPHLLRAAAVRPTVEVMRALAVTQVALQAPEAAAVVAAYFDERPDDQSFRLQLYKLCYDQRRYDMAIFVLRDGLRRHPGDAAMTSQLAWLLAVSPHDSDRNGTEAVKLAEQLASDAGEKVTARILDILAAAYAEFGDYARAVETSRRAVTMATNDAALRKLIQARLDLYVQQRPYREAQQSTQASEPASESPR